MVERACSCSVRCLPSAIATLLLISALGCSDSKAPSSPTAPVPTGGGRVVSLNLVSATPVYGSTLLNRIEGSVNVKLSYDLGSSSSGKFVVVIGSPNFDEGIRARSAPAHDGTIEMSLDYHNL